MHVIKIDETEEVIDMELKKANFEELLFEYEGIVIKNILKNAFDKGLISAEKFNHLEEKRLEKYSPFILKIMPNKLDK